MTHSGELSPSSELPGWKTAASAAAGLLLAVLFILSGTWKITDPFSWAQRIAQLGVPANLSLAAACFFGVAETYAGVLVLVPRFRRWGAWLCGFLLLVFMVYIAFYYSALHGADCNCFPWLKRVVGPAFFVEDGAMLALAVIAGWWAKPSSSLPSAAIVLMAVVVFAGVSLGVSAQVQSSVKAPAQITVNGRPLSLTEGRFLIYFFDPECTHCNQAARDLAKLDWGDVTIIGVPTAQPQFGPFFMDHTGLHAAISNDLVPLRKTFHFANAPYAVAIEKGRQREALSDFDPQDLSQRLRKIGFVR
jgi:uncharacterized membrane protein YphA (DoxX/SURF4 family)